MKLWVSEKRGSRNGDGSREHPYRAVQQAADKARAGDEIIIEGGVYRECVRPARGGTDESRPVTYRAAEGQEVVITGAEVIQGWEQIEGDIWLSEVPNGFFGSYNPYQTVIYGDWYRDMGRVNHTGQVYLNGKALYEASSYEELASSEAMRWAWDAEYSKCYKWYTEQRDDMTLIYVRAPHCDLNEEMVEINVRQEVFFPLQTGINYITVSGLVLKQAATQWAPPTAFQDGLIGPHWSRGWIIENCTISDSRCCGISLGKCLFPSNNRWTEYKIKDGSQLERDTVLYAQHMGWSRDTVGSHVVRHCKIFNCGQAGIVGHLGGAFSRIEDCEIHHINSYGEFSGSELAGIKLHGAIDTLIQRNHIHHCQRGMWLDWQAQGTRVTQNLFHDNSHDEDTRISEDLYIEVSHGPTLVDNNFFLSMYALRERSQGMAFVHNLIAGPIDRGSSGGRFTPYHFPHETDVMGFMTINGGDNRFYNNIFVQTEIPPEKSVVQEPEFAELVGAETTINTKAGLHVYDDCPTHEQYYFQFKDENTPISPWGHRYDYQSPLPVYTGGNVYCNGAKPYGREENPVILSEQVKIELVKEDSGYFLKTNLYENLKGRSDIFVSTKVLGKAFEPEQAFENPDGSCLRIDTDYFGNRRKAHPMPGPLEEGATLKESLV